MQMMKTRGRTCELPQGQGQYFISWYISRAGYTGVNIYEVGDKLLFLVMWDACCMHGEK